MKILVAIKRVVDFNVKIRAKADGSGVELDNVKMSMNPFDEIAVEAALRLKEAGLASEVLVVSVGDSAAIDTIRSALAMGADRGVLVRAEGRLEPLAVAKALRAIVEREHPQLTILGKQAIDDDANQTGQMLAALLDWPAATFASQIELGEIGITVTREVDRGHETVRMSLPAVVTVDLRLNEPRYPTLPNVMRAKRKPVDEVAASELNLDTAPRLKVINVREPPPRRAGVKLNSAADLVERLRNEAEVL
jgi:electron transfer flavoprotein beta subunit